jgi:threonine aldolase
MTPAELKRGCDTFVHGHLPRPAHAVLRELADFAEAGGHEPDVYGSGSTIQAFEQRVAERLGKPAAVFMPSGTMAQSIALRIWAERSGRRSFGLHATSHLDRDEQRGYAHLHGLHATLLGVDAHPFGPADFDRCHERLAAVVVELPARRLGGRLTPMADLHAMAERCQARGARLHLDGARLWEAAAGYGLPHAEICAPFDSVYVSVYKGVGAMAGALLAGPTDLIAEARIWQRRHGGNLPTLHPFVLGAELALDRQIERMPAFLARARSMVATASGLPGLRFVPGVPEVNMVHVHFDASPEVALAARDAVAAAHRVWLFGGVWPTQLGCATELAMYDGALSADPERLQSAWISFSRALSDVTEREDLRQEAPGGPSVSGEAR